MNKRKALFKDKNIIITGGSSGIGLAIAEKFAADGAHLFLLARDKSRLGKVSENLRDSYPEVLVTTYSVDVSDQTNVLRIINEIGTQGGIDIVISNAGISECQLFAKSDLSNFKTVMDVNYHGTVNVIHASWKYLVSSKGHIGIVNSVGGYLGIIGYSNYSASKFALTGLAECLRLEAKDKDIGLTVIYPPDTDTPLFHNEAKLPDNQALSAMAGLWSAEKVAKKLINGIVQNKFEVSCGFENRLYLVMKVLFPKFYHGLSDWMVARARKSRR
jgi:3-dehydrosphinganine reductase